MSGSFHDLVQLAGRAALVTGASRGIGLAIARALAACGAQVALCGRKAESLERAAAEIQAQGGKAIAIAAHVGRADDVGRLVAKSVEAFGRLDVVVNNAAVNPTFGPLTDGEEAAFDKVLAVNLKGPWLVCKAAHPHLKVRGGSVVNVGSVAGVRPERGLGFYSASKAALHSLTQTLALEWGGDGIRVNAICPGLVKTDFSAALWSDPVVLDQFLSRTPLRMLATPEDVAPLAVYLASDAAAFCTGALFRLDGGASI